VPLTGKQKAALLLASLDPATAAEMLKGVDAATVQDLAVELSYLDATGHRNASQTADVARQFCQSLQSRSTFHFKNFLRDMLRNTVGEEQAKRIQREIQDLLQKRDPFIAIRSAAPQTLAAVLETEHPQAVAVVLSELPPRKSSEVLGLLGEGVRVSAISRMTSIGGITMSANASRPSAPPSRRARRSRSAPSRRSGKSPSSCGISKRRCATAFCRPFNRRIRRPPGRSRT
jgi:flagellar motor switch protein FliG